VNELTPTLFIPGAGVEQVEFMHRLAEQVATRLNGRGRFVWDDDMLEIHPRSIVSGGGGGLGLFGRRSGIVEAGMKADDTNYADALVDFAEAKIRFTVQSNGILVEASGRTVMTKYRFLQNMAKELARQGVLPNGDKLAADLDAERLRMTGQRPTS